jgi:hypothetical protein
MGSYSSRLDPFPQPQAVRCLSGHAPAPWFGEPGGAVLQRLRPELCFLVVNAHANHGVVSVLDGRVGHHQLHGGDASVARGVQAVANAHQTVTKPLRQFLRAWLPWAKLFDDAQLGKQGCVHGQLLGDVRKLAG